MKFSQGILKAPLNLVALAVLLPIVVVVAGTAVYLSMDQRQRLAESTRVRAEQIMEVADVWVMSDLSAIELLSDAPALEMNDLPRFETFLKRAQLRHPQWAAAALCTTDDDALVAVGDARLTKELCLTQNRQLWTVSRHEGSLTTVSLVAPVTRDGKPVYWLSVLRSTEDIQSLLETHVGDIVVAAIVDRNARFIARTLDYKGLGGELGSASLQEAVRHGGGQGVYRGRTLESAETYTAYFVSPKTRWSTHIAVSAQLLDAPRSGAIAVSFVAGLLALLLATALVFVLGRDLNQRQVAAERLRHAEKLEAVGQLTAGVAHDFNNILAGIIGSLGIVTREVKEMPRALKFSEAALASAQRGARVTAQLLSFASVQRLKIEPTDLAAVLRDTETLLRPALGPGIELRADIDLDARWVATDRTQLEVALINLAINARHAMPNGGALSVKARRADAQLLKGLDGDNYVDLLIHDTGVGMDGRTLARAMEPFFTTKSAGSGTGLGLSQVFGMMKQSAGDLKIESTPGIGTKVHLIFPVSAPAPDNSSPTPPNDAVTNESATILIVDDEENVRNALAAALEDLGYQVTVAADARAADIALSNQRFAFALIDFLLGEDNGADIAERVRLAQPAAKIIIMTGYGDTSRIDAATPTAVLRKPFEVHALQALIRSLQA